MIIILKFLIMMLFIILKVRNLLFFLIELVTDQEKQDLVLQQQNRIIFNGLQKSLKSQDKQFSRNGEDSKNWKRKREFRI